MASSCVEEPGTKVAVPPSPPSAAGDNGLLSTSSMEMVAPPSSNSRKALFFLWIDFFATFSVYEAPRVTVELPEPLETSDAFFLSFKPCAFSMRLLGNGVPCLLAALIARLAFTPSAEIDATERDEDDKMLGSSSMPPRAAVCME